MERRKKNKKKIEECRRKRKTKAKCRGGKEESEISYRVAKRKLLEVKKEEIKN
jgi:hypothetical protein